MHTHINIVYHFVYGCVYIYIIYIYIYPKCTPSSQVSPRIGWREMLHQEAQAPHLEHENPWFLEIPGSDGRSILVVLFFHPLVDGKNQSFNMFQP